MFPGLQFFFADLQIQIEILKPNFLFTGFQFDSVPLKCTILIIFAHYDTAK